ncbi:MAG: glutathione S-transferase family protein [Alphaproteobacteria bacterium]|nr:glutathione S-transferase family protein [Alphaproteobacteria bacterium]MCW5740034.1 glutathione S-transferase family protein [Alphaproteobacteria bacterium]
MEPILLYGHPLGSSMGLVAALEWLGEPYRLSRVLMPDDMLDETYARLNGRQETPVLITEDGRVLSETMAIALWLEARDTQRRISFAPGSAEADRLHQVMAFLNTGFTAAFSAYWVALEMATPDAAYQAALRRFGRAQVNNRHRKLETMMGDTPYLAGDRPTLADALFVGVARWADFHDAIDAAEYPRIAALRRRLDADAAVRFATAIENGETPAGVGALRGHVALSEVPRLLAA